MSYENKLAHEIATALDDLDALPVHIQFCQKYSEAFLRKMLLKALSVPQEKIRKTRGALYTSLVQRNGWHSRD
jgi:hypothetical protein